jgi:hypothetical protein
MTDELTIFEQNRSVKSSTGPDEPWASNRLDDRAGDRERARTRSILELDHGNADGGDVPDLAG